MKIDSRKVDEVAKISIDQFLKLGYDINDLNALFSWKKGNFKERQKLFQQMRDMGYSFGAIGRLFGCSKQRVFQIVNQQYK